MAYYLTACFSGTEKWEAQTGGSPGCSLGSLPGVHRRDKKKRETIHNKVGDHKTRKVVF